MALVLPDASLLALDRVLTAVPIYLLLPPILLAFSPRFSTCRLHGTRMDVESACLRHEQRSHSKGMPVREALPDDALTHSFDREIDLLIGGGIVARCIGAGGNNPVHVFLK